MFDFFQPVIDVFNFIGGILQSIIDGVYGCISIITSVFQLVNSLIGLLPNPLYGVCVTTIYLYSIIFTYKLFRKG